MLLRAEREAVAAAGRHLAASGLVAGAAGNLSLRAGDRLAVTPTGLALGALRPEQVTVIDLDGRVVDGDLTPTSEVPLHLAVSHATEAAAIVHTHAVASTAVACQGLVELPPLHYACVQIGGPVRVAAYATFGTAELATNVAAALDGRTAALMANHGSIAVGDDLLQAGERLELLEWLCELHLRAMPPRRPRPLSPDQLADVARALASGRYGQAGGPR